MGTIQFDHDAAIVLKNLFSLCTACQALEPITLAPIGIQGCGGKGVQGGKGGQGGDVGVQGGMQGSMQGGIQRGLAKPKVNVQVETIVSSLVPVDGERGGERKEEEGGGGQGQGQGQQQEGQDRSTNGAQGAQTVEVSFLLSNSLCNLFKEFVDEVGNNIMDMHAKETGEWVGARLSAGGDGVGEGGGDDDGHSSSSSSSSSSYNTQSLSPEQSSTLLVEPLLQAFAVVPQMVAARL